MNRITFYSELSLMVRHGHSLQVQLLEIQGRLLRPASSCSVREVNHNHPAVLQLVKPREVHREQVRSRHGPVRDVAGDERLAGDHATVFEHGVHDRFLDRSARKELVAEKIELDGPTGPQQMDAILRID